MWGSILPLSSPPENIFVRWMKKAMEACRKSKPAAALPPRRSSAGTGMANLGEKRKARPTASRYRAREPRVQRSLRRLLSGTLGQQLGAVVDRAGAGHGKSYPLSQL